MLTKLQKYYRDTLVWAKRMSKAKTLAEVIVLETKRPRPTKALVELGILVSRKKGGD